MNWTEIRTKALAIAEDKGHEYNDPNLPRTQLRSLASELGVDRLELREMDGDALVVERQSGHFTMFLNSGQAQSRHRFSTAHEVSHLLLAPLVAHGAVHRRRFSTQDDEGRRIEFLCNDMASAILMPRGRVLAVLAQTGPTARSVPRIVEGFGVSFEAAARRYVDVSSLPCVLVKWIFQAGARKEERPVSNFWLGGAWLKFTRPTSPSPNNVTVSKENLVIYPGRRSRSAPVYVEEATTETLRHGHGRYQRMFSFVYVPNRVVKELQGSSVNYTKRC